MDKNDLPLGFCFALAQNPDAMKIFSLLSYSQRNDILQKARSVSSKEEMQELVQDLAHKK